MSDYINLVVVKLNAMPFNSLFCAPNDWKCKLTAGDKVVCYTKLGKQEGIVVTSYCTCPDYDDFNAIVAAAGATLPLNRILQKITFNEFDYSDYENDEKFNGIICSNEEEVEKEDEDA